MKEHYWEAKEHCCTACGQIFTAQGMVSKCMDCRRPPSPSGVWLGKELTPREKQVITLVCDAKANKEIAHALRLTEGTVKTYMNRIFDKTGAVNRVDLALRNVAGRL